MPLLVTALDGFHSGSRSVAIVLILYSIMRSLSSMVE